jgi:hypothetical protein
VLPSGRETKQPLLLYPASKQDLALADQALATFVQEQLQQPLQTNKKGDHTCTLVAAEALKQLVKLHCPGVEEIEAFEPETAAAAAFPRSLPGLQHLSTGILALPDLSSSDTALLTAPGFLQRVKNVSAMKGRIIKVIDASFGRTGKAPAGAAKAAAAASSVAAAAGSGALRQAADGASQLGLVSWYESARQQLMLVLGSPHPVSPSCKCTLSDSISAVVLRATGLARLVVQMHNLLLRGALPQHEVQLMQSWILQQQAQLARHQLQMQLLFIARLAARHTAALEALAATAIARIQAATAALGQLQITAPAAAAPGHLSTIPLPTGSVSASSIACRALSSEEVRTLVRMHCPGIFALRAAPAAAAPGSHAAAAAAPEYWHLPVQQHYLPGVKERKHMPEWTSSDAALLSWPGIEQRCKADATWELLQDAFEALWLSSGRTGPGADSAPELGPGSGSAGASTAQCSSQQHPSLQGFFESARNVLLALAHENVIVQVLVSFDASGLLLCIVRLARMVAQMHNLLLRGDLPLEERQTLGFE